MSNDILNPYIMVDVDDESVSTIADSMESVLKNLDIPYSRLSNAHISLAYILGEHKKEFLKDLISEIAEEAFMIRPVGVKILEGKTTDKDYVVLLLESDSEDFEYAHDLIKETCPIKTFDGAFTAHLSLFAIEKGSIPKKDWFSLCRIIEMHGSEIISQIKIKGKNVSVFGSDRVKEIEEKLPEN